MSGRRREEEGSSERTLPGSGRGLAIDPGASSGSGPGDQRAKGAQTGGSSPSGSPEGEGAVGRETEAPQGPAEAGGEGTGTRKHRRGRKRTRIRMPDRMPLPVRALWQAASPGEREKAHRCAVTILEAWPGKTTREEVSRRLGVRRLRSWQMRQQAVAGMVAGLLVQPKARVRRPGAGLLVPEEDVRVLKKRVSLLEGELEETRGLVALLREMPAHRDGRATGPPARERRHGKGAGRRAASADAGGGGGEGRPKA